MHQFTIGLMFLYSSLFFNQAKAIISNQTVLTPELDSALKQHQNAICRLVIYDENKKIKSNCTASLVDKNLAISGAHCLQNMDKKNKIELLCGFQPDSKNTTTMTNSETGNQTIYNQNLFQFRRIITTHELPKDYIDNGDSHYDFLKLKFSEPILLKKSEYLSFQTKSDYIQSIKNNSKTAECLFAGYGADSGQKIGDFHYSRAKIFQLSSDQYFELGGFIALDSSEGATKLQYDFDRIENAKKEIPKSWPQYDRLIESLNIKSLFTIANYAKYLPTEMSIATPGDSGSGLLCLNSKTKDLEIVAILRNVISNIQEVKLKNQSKALKVIILGNEAIPLYHIDENSNMHDLIDSDYHVYVQTTELEK